MDYTIHGILQARILEWVAFPFSRGCSQPRDRPRFPTLQVDSLPTEPQGKLKNAGVGSLSLFQQIFLTEELNQGLLHCRQILYQLSFNVNIYALENQKLMRITLLGWSETEPEVLLMYVCYLSIL